MKTWFEMKAAASGEKHTEVMIFDEIGLWGVTAKDFATALKAIPEDHAITVRINSPGGSVFDGYAIFNALKSRAASVTTKVEGLAASMASIVALAGIKVTAAANSMLMIHNPWSGVAGDSEDLRKTADLLDKLTSQLVGIYAGKSGKSEDEVRAAMDAETWFTAEEAQAWGLVDEVTDGVAAVASFDVSRFRNPPKALAAYDVSTQANHKQAEEICALKSERDALNAKLEAAAAERDTEKQRADALAEQLVKLNTCASDYASKLAAAESERDEARAELRRRDAEAAVDSAISAGRLAITARAEFVALFIADADKAKVILSAIPSARGNQPVPPEATAEAGAQDDAKLFAEYDSIKDQAARLRFLCEHEAAIWRHHTRN